MKAARLAGRPGSNYVFYPDSHGYGINSTCASNFAVLVFSECHLRAFTFLVRREILREAFFL